MMALQSLSDRSKCLQYVGSDSTTAVDRNSRSRLRSSAWHSRMSTPEPGMSRSRSYLDMATPLILTISPNLHTDSLFRLRATRNLLPIFISHHPYCRMGKPQAQLTNLLHRRFTI